jgi:hypothetical protein
VSVGTLLSVSDGSLEVEMRSGETEVVSGPFKCPRPIGPSGGLRDRLRGLEISPGILESLDNPSELFERLQRGLEPGIAPSDELQERMESIRRHIQEVEGQLWERMRRMQEERSPDAALQGQIS